MGRGASERVGGVTCRTAAIGVLLALLAAPAGAELIDRVLAAVNTEVITWSDLRSAMAVNEAVSGPPKDRKAAAAETLEGLINRKLLLQEARRLAGADVSEADVDAEVALLSARLGSERKKAEVLAQAYLTEGDLRRMLAERLLAERFLKKRVELFVRVSREEAEQYFQEHAAAFAGMRFRDVERQITNLLIARKTDAEITRVLADLRMRADIRINPLEGAGAAGREGT